MKERAFSTLLHARAKVGKSTLTTTAPTPMVVLDAEGGWRFLSTRGFQGKPLRVQHWDPMKTAPPRYDGTWDVQVVTVTGWPVLPHTLNVLTQQKHDFKTCSLDSITEIQRRCKASLGVSKMQYQDWGSLLDQMDACIRGFRDLTLIDTNPLEVAIFVAESRLDSGVMRPYMQGQIGNSLPYWMDVVGYLSVQQVEDPTAEGGKKTVRMLRVGAHPQVEAGERVQGRLGENIYDPDISKMINDVFGVTSEERK